MILYEAPHKLRTTLGDLLSVFGADRPLSLCRELTKRNEETMRTTVGGAEEYYREHEPRGEYVLILGGRDPEEKKAEAWWASLSVEEHVQHYLDENPSMKKLDAVKAAAKDRGVGRSEIYNAVMK